MEIKNNTQKVITLTTEDEIKQFQSIIKKLNDESTVKKIGFITVKQISLTADEIKIITELNK
jgi:hypothetical protein